MIRGQIKNKEKHLLTWKPLWTAIILSTTTVNVVSMAASNHQLDAEINNALNKPIILMNNKGAKAPSSCADGIKPYPRN